MENKSLDKSLNKFDDDLRILVTKLGDTSKEIKQIPLSNKITSASKAYNAKGFLKWLFTEYF